MQTTIRLREWATSYGVELTPAQRDALRTRFRATVQPSPGVTDRYDVTPGNVIGAAVVDGTQLLIAPKIPIDRLLWLLGYLTDADHWHQEDTRLSANDGVVDAVAALFVALSRRSLQRGLLAGYHDKTGDLPTVRGRIDLAEQLKRRPGLSAPLALRYTEYDHDILENQLLLAATVLLCRLPIRDVGTRSAVRRIAETLHDVTLIAIHPTRVPGVAWTRLNAHYRPAVELARLLLSQQSVEMTTGHTTGRALALNMADLFETFVRTALREAASLEAAVFPDGDRVPDLRLDSGKRITLKPDLSLWRSGCRFVGDVKYKRDAGPGRNADLYQLLAYATATRLPDATLIYAYGPPEVRTHVVPPSGIRLHVRHLDLALPGAQLLQDIADIAHELLPPAVTARPAAGA